MTLERSCVDLKQALAWVLADVTQQGLISQLERHPRHELNHGGNQVGVTVGMVDPRAWVCQPPTDNW